MSREQRLRELSTHSGDTFESFSDFEPINGVIEAKKAFLCKKKGDLWWKDAIKRINDIAKPINTDKN